MEQVSDWMIANPTTIGPDTPLIEAEWRMHADEIRHLPILDGGRLVGILTDRDVREAVPSGNRAVSVGELNYLVANLVAENAMRSPVITAGPDESIEAAAARMLEHRISCLPVVDGGSLIGILTTTDLLQALLDRLGSDRLQAPALSR